MSVFKRGKWYHYEFVFNGKRIQESARTSSKSLAIEAERQRRRELEQISIGVPVDKRTTRMRLVREAVDKYLETYGVNHRSASCVFATNRLTHVRRLLGATLLGELDENAIKTYMK